MSIIEIIFTSIFVISLGGISFILLSKVSALNRLPEPSEDLKKILISEAKKKAKNLPSVKDTSYEMYLQKILSRVRILTLKTDHKTSGWLEKLRQKNNNKNYSSNDKYWDELKKAKRGK